LWTQELELGSVAGTILKEEKDSRTMAFIQTGAFYFIVKTECVL
jgi:hypothetical protein